MQDYTISQLAREVNVNVETIRYYERLGLVRKPLRSANGYRHYMDSDVAQLHFIHNSQALGFTLKEIKQLLKIPLDNDTCCNDAQVMIKDKLNHIRGKIQQMKSIESQLQYYVASCGSNHDATACPLLDSLWSHKRKTISTKPIT